MLHGDQVLGRTRTRAIRSGVALRVLALRAEVATGSAELAATALVALALLCGTIVFVSPGHFRPVGAPPLSLFVAFGTLSALALTFAASLPLHRLISPRGRTLLGSAGLLTIGVLASMGAWETAMSLRSIHATTPYNNDGAAMDLYAARQVVHGHDPYLKTNIVYALAQIDAPATTTTPLMDGQFRGARAYPSPDAIERVFLNDLQREPRQIPPEFESKYNYPAGSFLFILPFVWAGMRDMRLLYVVAVLVLGAYLWRRSSRALRPLVPLLLLANVPLIVMTAGGQPDPLYGLFLALAFAEWPGRRSSPIFMGLAVSIKQLAWFFAPFYLLLVVRNLGWREALRRLAVMSAIFAVTNLPFVVQGPAQYAASISAPMSDPMFPLGVGVIALFVGNLVPMLPKIVFTLGELGSWGLSTVLGTRFRVPAAGLVVLGAFPLFFAWRSLTSYFYLVPLMALAVLLAEHDRGPRYRST
ncbi:MAG TPA: hypothetical protein VKX16_09845 [Chloroflexota bacterium]|nr:hypothetical protein [Chloroflexota bacterium]